MKYLSVCSGIEAASVAWGPLGWHPVAFSEVDKFPSAVLSHHYPGVPNLGDMTRFHEWPGAAVDVLVGGTPCQSFSVAGLRKGMADPRGNLALTYLAVLDRYRPTWCVWENVPGVLSADDGRAMGAFLGGLSELGYGWAYRSLDAQFFRVAQRRRRVFVVGCLGDWRRAAAVLFERESLSGHPAPSRETGQRAAGTVAARTRGGGGLGTDFDCDGGLVPSTGDISHCLNAGGMGRIDYETETLISHALRAEGFDASEDGSGRGTPLVPVGMFQNTGHGWWNQSDVAQTIRTPDGGGSMEANIVAFSAKDDGGDAGDIAPTLRAGGHVNSHANAGVMPAVAFNWQSGGDARGLKAQALSRSQAPATFSGAQVRRLTPRECERLQGFPDDYTLIPYRGKPASDGPRYKALGNSMAVPCMAWLGRRIEMVNAVRGRVV